MSLSFLRYGGRPDLHSFPTRRSSDLSAIPHGMIAANGSRLLLQLIANPWEVRPRETRMPTWAIFAGAGPPASRSEEQRLNSSHVASSYAVFCLKKQSDLVLYIVLTAI